MFKETFTEKERTYSTPEESAGSSRGIWYFLFTELILFGGIFIIYAVYRSIYREGFGFGSAELDSSAGLINTIVLLTSGLTIALALAALQRKQKLYSMFLIVFTVFWGSIFLINRIFEWGSRFNFGFYPSSYAGLQMEKGEIIFFNLFNLIIWLHALHVLTGMVFLTIIFMSVYKDKVTADISGGLRGAGLFWHVVVILWIFLFPLFYLIK